MRAFSAFSRSLFAKKKKISTFARRRTTRTNDVLFFARQPNERVRMLRVDRFDRIDRCVSRFSTFKKLSHKKKEKSFPSSAAPEEHQTRSAPFERGI